jgi:hypothetical protein
MKANSHTILSHLKAVEAYRERQAGEPAFAAVVVGVKRFQHARFQRTYTDLLTGRFARAARFFLDDLYGPHDFSERDAQFARIVPALVRLFPGDIVGTVAVLAELHALSEQLDAAMADQLASDEVSVLDYVAAWRRVGKREARSTQVDLMLTVGRDLQRYTRNPVLRGSLRLMRGPAKAAGLGALQDFLESGFDTFRDLGGHAPQFLETIYLRERQIIDWLFEGSFDDSPPVGF